MAKKEEENDWGLFAKANGVDPAMIDPDAIPGVDEPDEEADVDESQSAELVLPPELQGGERASAEPAPIEITPVKFEALKASAPRVPRPRPIHHGTHGFDVVAVKRALSRAGYLPWRPFTPVFGPVAAGALQHFQRDRKIEPASGAYGVQSHAALVNTHAKGSRTEWAFDATAIALMHQEAALLAETPEDKVRGQIVAAAYFLYGHRFSIPYVQSRPFPLHKPPYVPTHGIDCSATVTLCHYIGGAPDPNGRGYDGQGYTGTLMGRGRRCSFRELKPGDPIFYGFTTHPSPAFPYGSPTHVAVYVGGGMVISNGHHPMGHYPYNYRTVNHYRTYAVV